MHPKSGARFGKNLAAILKEFNLSQAELADKSTLTRPAISHYIKGNREPSLSSICKILSVIPVEFERLIR